MYTPRISTPFRDVILTFATAQGHVKDILDISRWMQIVYSASRSHDVIFSLSKKKEGNGQILAHVTDVEHIASIFR
jgi:hypothetical protein